MRILYLADIRFPLERANGIQSMETCHALAARGHDVTLAVRPDTETPPRDPFVFYGLPETPRLHVEVAPITGPAAARRAGYLTFALGRSLGRARQDLIFTRDLGLASLLLRVPRALRAPVVYEAHTIAAEAAAARPQLLTGAPAPSESKLRRLAARDAHVWRRAEGYVTITDGLKRALEGRFGGRPRIAVVPDGFRAAEFTEGTEKRSEKRSLATDDADYADKKKALATDDTDYTEKTSSAADYADYADKKRSATGFTEGRPFTIGYAGHLYPWKGVDLIVEAVAALPDSRGLIVGGHEKEPDLERVKAFARDLDCGLRITFTGMIPPRAVPAKLREADVLVLPNPASAISSEFTSPLKLFEYMASGRPIVASNLPSIREVLRHEENALLVEPGNPQALVAGIVRVKQDSELGRRLAARAQEDVQDYTWAKRAEWLDALFTAVREAGA